MFSAACTTVGEGAMRRQLFVFILFVVAACSNDQPGNDAGLDAPTSSDAGKTYASDAGCQPCVVGTSTVGNCCLQ
jgi:hypothetical protein